MDFLNFSKKRYVVFGLANKKSIATAITRNLIDQGAEVILVVRSEERRVRKEGRSRWSPYH